MKEVMHFNSFEEMYAFSRKKAREPKEYVEPKKKKTTKKKKEVKDEVLQAD